MSSVIISSILAGLATLLGTMVVIIFGRPSERSLSVFLGMAAGIMLAVVIIDLIPSALQYGTLMQTLLGFIVGAFILYIIDLLLSLLIKPHNSQNRQVSLLKMGYLIALGIALHDLPEGIAIAISSTATEKLGFIIALAIGLHNIPEGMAIAAPLNMGGVNRVKIIILTLFVSLFTPIGTILGFSLVNISNNLISFLLSLAAGAMTYLVQDELIPESHKRHPNYAKLGILLGFSVIVFVTLGG